MKKTNEKNPKEKGKKEEEDEAPKIKYNNDIRDIRSIK